MTTVLILYLKSHCMILNKAHCSLSLLIETGSIMDSSSSLGVAVSTPCFCTDLYLKIHSSYIGKGSSGAGMPFSFAWHLLKGVMRLLSRGEVF